MLNFDLSVDQLFDVYVKEVRSILELAVPVWHPGLTKKQSADIESIQKVAFRIILQNDYITYQLACTSLGAEALDDRRTRLCQKFAIKNANSERPMFEIRSNHFNTRQGGAKVREYRCNTTRFKKSSLPFLAKLLNTIKWKK